MRDEQVVTQRFATFVARWLRVGGQRRHRAAAFNRSPHFVGAARVAAASDADHDLVFNILSVFVWRSLPLPHRFNPTDFDCEAQLQFPLEEGATVCGYAVDIGGRMV